MPTVVARPARGYDEPVELQYTDNGVLGIGSFGVVSFGMIDGTYEKIAIKKVLQDERFKHRELEIMRKLNHKNIVQLKFFFYSTDDNNTKRYLSLILEYMPKTVYDVEKHYFRVNQPIPIIYVKLYTFQLFRALAYIHSLGICHRDIKPQNLLIDPATSVLKLCDFGSAKYLVKGEPNLSYICSRYYRAPELLFGSNEYACSIDVWSAGTVLAELLLGQPLFAGGDLSGQLAEIIRIIGTPTKAQIYDMNPKYAQQNLPLVKATPWSRIFRVGTCSEVIDLISRIIVYSPDERPKPLQVCAHCFFDDLRQSRQKLPNGYSIPMCTDFTREEVGSDISLLSVLNATHFEKSTSIEIKLESKVDASSCGIQDEMMDSESAGDSVGAHRVF